jgi:photoactive yellow protein
MPECSASMVTHTSVRARFVGRKGMAVSDNNFLRIPFGMFELDATGVVIHYSPASEEKRDGLVNAMVGKNFFDHLISIAQVEELKRRFLTFMADGDSVERFSLSFPFNHESVKVQIVMAHLIERTERGRERFALIRLMPEKYATAA